MDSHGLSPSAKAQLHETADLLLTIYKTLAEMRYIDSAGILLGPHDIEALRPSYEKLGLDPAVIYLYSIMPYVDGELAGNWDFLHGGTFANYLSERSLERVADPFYASPSGDDFEAEHGPYMRPWMTPLSDLGNHDSVIIYDTKEHRIWIVDQLGWNSTDLALRGQRGTSTSNNTLSFVHIPSRPAGDVLRDINDWYRKLEEVPGGGERSGAEWNRWDLDLKGLYQKNGWPDAFDGDAFQVDQARAYCADKAKDRAEQPLREVETYQEWSEYSKQDIQRGHAELESATTDDERWLARYNIWRAEEQEAQTLEDLKKAQEDADKYCPGGVCQKEEDLPLWEAEMLRHVAKEKEELLERNRNWEEKGKDDPERYKHLHTKFLQRQKIAAIYKKACEASEADAARLCPGKTFQSATGIKSPGRNRTLTNIEDLQKSIDSMETDLARHREWAVQVPEDATQAKGKVAHDIEGIEKGLERARKSKKRVEDWAKEHGNQD